MTAANARLLSKQLKPIYGGLRRAVDILEGEIDPLLVIVRESLAESANSTKRQIEALAAYQS